MSLCEGFRIEGGSDLVSPKQASTYLFQVHIQIFMTLVLLLATLLIYTAACQLMTTILYLI